MPRKTLILGNGIGMALDPDFFSLDRAIGAVWNNQELLEEHCKELIRHCLPGHNEDRPHGEDDLDTLQIALTATEFLAGLAQGQIHWLSEEGLEFPKAVRKFIYQTAVQFHLHERRLPESFLEPLADFIRNTQTHIATLNYDNLLYQPLIEREVLRGYSGALVDGFHSDGFALDNLERRFGRTFGYYLHLHGSPLFVDRNNRIYKIHQAELDIEEDTISSHIVLTHVNHKPIVISSSELLITYWRYLLFALSESDEIILFGYSGSDKHLNSILKSLSKEKPIRIIEWSGAGTEEERTMFWTDELSTEVTLIQLDSILDFTDW